MTTPIIVRYNIDEYKIEWMEDNSHYRFNPDNRVINRKTGCCDYDYIGPGDLEGHYTFWVGGRHYTYDPVEKQVMFRVVKRGLKILDIKDERNLRYHKLGYIGWDESITKEYADKHPGLKYLIRECNKKLRLEYERLQQEEAEAEFYNNN
jgi:hypothetical protein